MLAALEEHKASEPINGFNEAHLRRFMRRLGFTEGAPTPQAAAIDAAVVRECPCNECGYKHTRYLPFTNGKRYKAFAICNSCNYYEEF